MTTGEPMSKEALVLHAVLDEQDDQALKLLRTFQPGEVADLFGAAVKLAELCTRARREQGDAIHWGNGRDGDGQTRHDGLRESCTDPGCALHNS